MQILFVEPYYEPDGGPAAPLYGMLCRELVGRGHQVTVLTAVPHYPSGRVPPAYSGLIVRRTIEDGVQVIRIPVPSIDRSNLFQRLLQFFAYQVGAVYAGWKIDCDVFVAATPSLEVWLPFVYFSSIRRKPSVYSIHDVYPDAGVQLGIFRQKPIIKLVTLLEQFCANRSSFVRILSNSFRDSIKRLGVHESKIRLVYDWVDTDLIRPLPKTNAFSVYHGLSESFVALYAGNLGFSQGLEMVLDVAEFLGDEEIQFVFVGDGPAKVSLRKKASSRHLSNVKFIPFQPRERLPEVLATADVSLVILLRAMGFNSLPSKTLSILASGRPMIVSVDPGSDTWYLVERSQAGVCIPPENPHLLAEAILKVKKNAASRKEMGKRGRQYALEYHSPSSAAEAFEEILRQALDHNLSSD